MAVAHDQAFATHLPSLFEMLLRTDGAVLEIGAGAGSTPLLLAFCKAMGRRFLSVEGDKTWADKFVSIYSPDYAILPEVASILGRRDGFGVVFIDHAPESRRWSDALLFVNVARYIVMHDFQSQETNDGFKVHGDLWTHHRVDDRLFPSTLILSQGEI